MNQLESKYERRFPPVIDSSMRVDYSSCPRKFFYRHVLGLAPLGQNIHLTAGSAYARGLEVFRKAYYGEGHTFIDARALGALALIIEYGDPDFEPSEAKQWHAMIDAYISYLANYKPDEDYLHPLIVNNSPAVEFSFALPIDDDLRHPQTNDPLLYCGRFDMLGEMSDTLFVVDDKTTSRLGAQWARQWNLRSQFTGYCWGAQQFDYPVGGAIIRGTAILKTKITHAEAIVYRPQFMIDRWKDRLYWSVDDMIAAFKTQNWPTHGEENGACASYSGCQYEVLCSANNPFDWIEGNFIVEYWNPVHTEEIK